jgi:hypothetical protein
MPYVVTAYNATPEARPTGNGRAEPRPNGPFGTGGLGKFY